MLGYKYLVFLLKIPLYEHSNENEIMQSAQPLYMEMCAAGGEVAGVRVNEQVIFMNDTAEVGEKMLRLREPLQINLPVKSSMDGVYF